ncbi:MAG TPA: hypothetical protein VHT52_19205 [Stellaceae bacterium]|jgi:hypothetical protein|nr:hypothetical protein [Stellaceae bacterium]
MMPNDFDPDAYLKQRGGQSQQPAFDPDAYLEKRSRGQHPVLWGMHDAGKGIAKNLAADVSAGYDLANAVPALRGAFPPLAVLGAVPQGAMQTVADFANSPSASTAETVGYYGADAASMLAAPEIGVGKVAGAAVEKAAPYVAKAAPTAAVLYDAFAHGGGIRDLILLPTLQYLANKAAPYMPAAARWGGLAAEKTATPGAIRGAAAGAKAVTGGDDNGRTGAPRPARPAPTPTGGGAPRSAGKPGVRDNNPPADQRSNRRWSNLDYFRDSEKEQGP